MLVSDILTYWYTIEIPQAPRRLHGLILITADMFSMPRLWRTLFTPWRRDVIPTAGLAIQERLRVFAYNMVAVLVGFVVRLFVLFAASLVVAASMVFGSVVLFLWVVMPLLAILLFFVGVVMLFR